MSNQQAATEQSSPDLEAAMGNEQPKADVEPKDDFILETGTEDVVSTDKPGESDSKPEEKLFDQESANKAFIKNKQKLNAEREEKERLRLELEEAKKKIEAANESGPPEIPPIPDQFDENADKLYAERDEAIRKFGEYNRDQALRAEQLKAAQAAQVLERQAAKQKEIADYLGRAKTLGMDEKALFDAENIVGAYIRNSEVANFILSEENGPLAVSHLAKNPDELEKIASMSPMAAAVYISNSVIPEAIKSKPKPTQTPEPAPTYSGKGSAPKQHPALDGVKME